MRKFYFWAASLWTAGIAVSCLISMRNFEEADIVEGTDKYVHSTFYFVLTLLWYLYLLKKMQVPKHKLRLYVLLGAFSFGLLIEFCQGVFTRDRSADIQDVIANTSGSLLAVLVLWIIERLKK